MAEPPRLILASGSSARKSMLLAAGVNFDVTPAEIDEAGIRHQMTGNGNRAEPARIAGTLALEKACAVSRQNREAFVIGSDQVLNQNANIISKAESVDGARGVLQALRGTTHHLVSAVVLARGGEPLWQACDVARMTMRNFSDAFLDAYLTQSGGHILQSVGCYQLEGTGIQLFERIEGDYFTILGMPLLPLLNELRGRGMVPA